MPHKSIQVSHLVALKQQAEAELARAKKEVERATAKVLAAEVKLKTFVDILAGAGSSESGEAPQEKSRKDWILEIIEAHDGEGLTAREIFDELKLKGVNISSSNPTASVHMAAQSLLKDELIESSNENGTLVFKPKKADMEEFG